MGVYLLLGNGAASVSLLVAFSAIKRSAMAAYVGTSPRFRAAAVHAPKLTGALSATPRETATTAT